MKQGSEVVIIGGGVIGLTTAYYLAGAGGTVTLLDRQSAGNEASWAGAGILPPSDPLRAVTPFDRLRALSQSLFPSLSTELQEATGIDNGYWVCGGIELAAGEAPLLEEEWRGEGVEVAELTECQMRELEPELASDIGPGYLLPHLAQIRNPHHLQALKVACLKRGVDLAENVEVIGVRTAADRITAVATREGDVHGNHFLFTAGAWTDDVLPRLGVQSGIRPVRGQIVLLRSKMPLLRHVLMHGSQYIVPRRDGRILVGSTEEHGGFDKRTTAQAVSGLIALAVRLVPALQQAEVEKCWAGLRPGSPDMLPIIGPVPGWSNASVGAGHFRAGLQLSTGTALLLKEMILGENLSLDASAFRLDRVPSQR